MHIYIQCKDQMYTHKSMVKSVYKGRGLHLLVSSQHYTLRRNFGMWAYMQQTIEFDYYKLKVCMHWQKVGELIWIPPVHGWVFSQNQIDKMWSIRRHYSPPSSSQSIKSQVSGSSLWPFGQIIDELVSTRVFLSLEGNISRTDWRLFWREL